MRFTSAGRQIAGWVIAVGLSVTGSAAGGAPAGNRVTPGAGIGLYRIGSVTPKAPPGARLVWTDSAMMKTGEQWRLHEPGGRSCTLSVYTESDTMGPKVIHLVRVTCPRFRTAEGLGVGSRLAAIRRAFPELRVFSRYTADRKRVDIWDSTGGGIGFEVPESGAARGRAIAVIVHQPGVTAPLYLSFPFWSDLKPVHPFVR